MNDTQRKQFDDIRLLIFDQSRTNDSDTGSTDSNRLEICYSLNFTGSKDYTLDFIKDTKAVVWFHKYAARDTHCEHCGYGKDVYVIGLMNDGNYYYFCYWDGCLSYDPEVKNSGKIYVSNSFIDIYDFCMDDKARMLYDDSSKLSDDSDIDSDDPFDKLSNWTSIFRFDDGTLCQIL